MRRGGSVPDPKATNTGSIIMREDKIKKELLQKIFERLQLAVKIEAVEKATGKPWEELHNLTIDGMKVSDQSLKLLNDINSLLVETKYFPLTGLADAEQKILNCFLEIIESNKNFLEEDVEKFLDCELLSLKDNMKERLKQVKTLLLTVDIDSRTNDLYREVIGCYVHGAFEAGCVLCRAIVEAIAKRYIEYKGYGNLLVGEEKQLKKLTVPGILREKLSIKKEIIETYSRITRKADRILHERDEKAEEKDALEAIQLLQSFIEKFPKTL